MFSKKPVVKISQNLETISNKVAGWSSLQSVTLLKEKTSTQVLSCEFFKTYENTYFVAHLQTAASDKNCFYQSIAYFITETKMITKNTSNKHTEAVTINKAKTLNVFRF